MGRNSFITAIIALLFAFIPTKSLGQDVAYLRHIVQRGETIGTLAERYKLTTDMLKNVNLGMGTFHTGQEIVVPVDKRYVAMRTDETDEEKLLVIAEYFEEYQKAAQIFNTRDYKKAEKAFKHAAQLSLSIPGEEAYFGKAMCNYNRKKWKAAIEDFSQVIDIEDCPEELREQSRLLRANAQEKRDARRQRTAEFFGNLLQTAAEVGTAYLAASQANAGMGYNYPSLPQGKSLGSMSEAEFTNYVNSSLTQLANYSCMQVEQRWAQEKMQINTMFINTYRQLHGGESPSAEEVEANYNYLMQIKANAYSDRTRANSGMYGEEESSSTRQKTSSGYKCAQCLDKHVCTICNGTGWQDSGLGDLHDHGGGVGNIKCGNCKGSGKCPFCK